MGRALIAIYLARQFIESGRGDAQEVPDVDGTQDAVSKQAKYLRTRAAEFLRYVVHRIKQLVVGHDLFLSYLCHAECASRALQVCHLEVSLLWHTQSPQCRHLLGSNRALTD